MHLDKNEPTTETRIETQDLVCPICMSIAGDPQITSCCHRIFCIKHADLNQYHNGCPLCRERDFKFKPSPKHKEMLGQLTIQCACSEYIAPDDYENHLDRCLNTTFTCPHSACREKNNETKYNSQELINHLARYHCNEVPLLGKTYVEKKSVKSYRKASKKYDDLVSTLYNVIYPKMIKVELKNSLTNQQKNSSIFKCPQGHPLIEADHAQRKRRNGTVYSSAGFNCDICHHVFTQGSSWHCSCSNSGFDKCIACFVFQLYNLDDPNLKLANESREKQQQHSRQRTLRETVRSSRQLFQLLSENISDDDTDYDDDDQINYALLGSRLSQPLFLSRQNTTDTGNNETNL
ncbi:hypothetical protein I4U23_002972 [Adineta vaga]|nr:hypothetical protein I4U23_002972 [Adineta vaga]